MLGCVQADPRDLPARFLGRPPLDRLSRKLLARTGQRDPAAPLTIDLDSHLRDLRWPGLGIGSGARGYHPLLANAAGTGG